MLMCELLAGKELAAFIRVNPRSSAANKSRYQKLKTS
jgi:hypothetical protein